MPTSPSGPPGGMLVTTERAARGTDLYRPRDGRPWRGGNRGGNAWENWDHELTHGLLGSMQPSGFDGISSIPPRRLPFLAYSTLRPRMRPSSASTGTSSSSARFANGRALRTWTTSTRRGGFAACCVFGATGFSRAWRVSNGFAGKAGVQGSRMRRSPSG